jgi:hypothetical protein
VVAIHLAEVPRMTVVAPSVLQGRALPRQPEDLADFPWIAIPAFYRREITLTHAGTGEQRQVASARSWSPTACMRCATSPSKAWGGRRIVVGAGRGCGRRAAGAIAARVGAGALPVSLMYPYARFYPARLRHFIDTMKEAMPSVVHQAVGRGARRRARRDVNYQSSRMVLWLA